MPFVPGKIRKLGRILTTISQSNTSQSSTLMTENITKKWTNVVENRSAASTSSRMGAGEATMTPNITARTVSRPPASAAWNGRSWADALPARPADRSQHDPRVDPDHHENRGEQD